MSASPQRRGEAGYNLVILIVAITILNILLALSLPLWSTAIRREKEEELIFRGIQYAEAIRIFFNKHQQYPTRLEELIKREPRTLRQLWKDPMTEDGQWGLIFHGQQGQQPLRPPGQPPRAGRPLQPQPEGQDETEDGEDPDGRESPFGPRKGEEVAVGPIVGVYSKSGKESIMTFFGKERYDEWRFTVDILTQQQGLPRNEGGVGVPGGGLTLSTRWLGRPLPYLDQYSQQIPGVNQPPVGLGGPTGGQRPRTGTRPPNRP
ncbi:MAG TPA: type II secretion system protein [Thermoanaerobaculia bacterium]|nr:type II secretion system protein [Thermoanaerobaculia bacterium]